VTENINIHLHSHYYQIHWLTAHFFLHHSTTCNTPYLSLRLLFMDWLNEDKKNYNPVKCLKLFTQHHQPPRGHDLQHYHWENLNSSTLLEFFGITCKSQLYVVEITNTMHRSAPLLYSICWLLHVSAVACHHLHSAGKHNRLNHDTPTHRPLNRHYMIYHQIDLYFHVTQTDPEVP
jgi:hypothetical protein